MNENRNFPDYEVGQFSFEIVNLNGIFQKNYSGSTIIGLLILINGPIFLLSLNFESKIS